jgi:hypothetical protein
MTLVPDLPTFGEEKFGEPSRCEERYTLVVPNLVDHLLKKLSSSASRARWLPRRPIWASPTSSLLKLVGGRVRLQGSRRISAILTHMSSCESRKRRPPTEAAAPNSRGDR